MNRSVFAGLLVVAVLTATGAVGSASVMEYDGDPAGSVDSTGVDSPSVAPAVSQDSSDQQFDRTYFEITVHENGSATWTSRHERVLETDDRDDVEAFEDFADEFKSEETDLYRRFVGQAGALTETGAEQTDREMEAANFNRSAYVDPQLQGAVGVVEMTFLWTEFADVDEDGDTVVVGDAFDGLYLDSNQQLIVEAGDDLVFASARPEGEYSTSSIENANSITWRGDQEFIDGQPRVVLERRGGDAGGSIVPTDSPALAAATLLIVSLAVVGAFAWRRTTRNPTEAIGAVVPGDDDGATADEGGSLAGDELLTDEDRVVKLIRENGGRMKQVDIVEETGWSKSKVSMLLSEMETEGTISKLRVGRENIISLDGFEPEATKSPFDE